MEEYDVWFFKVPESGQDLYSGEPAFFDLERGADGTFVASLPPGSYHAEAFAYDFKTDTPYKPQLAGGFNSPTVFTIVDNTTSITNVTFSLEAEYRMSHEFAPVEGTVTVAGKDEVDHVFFDLFPVVDGVRQKPITKKYVENFVMHNAEISGRTDEEIRNFHRNQKLIDLNETPPTLCNEIWDEYQKEPVGQRRDLLNFFVEKKLNNLIETIGEF